MRATLNYELEKAIRSLPGYDPFKDAEGFVFDTDEAARRLAFIGKFCTFSHGPKAAKPFQLEEWQRGFTANLFGWKRADNLAMRRYRQALLMVGRGNGKSDYAATLINSVGFQDRAPGAQIYSIAGKRDQTRFVFEPVRKMILANPHMSKAAKVYQHSIMFPEGKSYRSTSRQATTEHGGTTYLAMFDELHVQPDRLLYDTVLTSTAKVQESLLVCLTTSDWEREGSICNEVHKYASSVRDGIFSDPTFLPCVYEAKKEDDWQNPDVWRKANPNLNVSIMEADLARLCKQAQEQPSFLNEFLRLHLNIRTQQAFAWMLADKWDACAGEIDIALLRGRACWGGMDLATVSDMAALVLAFPVDDKIFLLPFFWCPEETAEARERNDRQPYLTWARAGLVDLTPGNRIDYRYIRRRIKELAAEYSIQEIACDPHNASTLMQQLQDEDGVMVFEHRQGSLSMNEPMKTTMRMVLGKEIIHGGHPVLRWNMLNVSAVRDVSDNLRPDKKASHEKIDGAVAAMMAIGRAASGMSQRCYYDEHEMRFV